MAVKGPGPRAPDVGRVQAQKGPPLSPLESALLASGIAKTPTQARVLARSLVAALKQAGFPAPPGGGVEQQLRSFQQQHGLPVTGKLDDATRAKLADVGILPKESAAPKGDAKGTAPSSATSESAAPKLDAAPAVPKGWTSFVPQKAGGAAPQGGAAGRGERTHVVAHEQTRARAELAKDGSPKDLSHLLSSLSRLGFLGGGKGKQRLEGALRGLQLSAGLPPTGKLDRDTVKELISRGVLPESTELPSTSSSSASAKGGEAAADRRGLSERKGDPSAAQGKGESPGQAQGARGQGGEAASLAVATGNSGDVRDGDERGEADDDANAPAGDEDWADERRGHATPDDGGDDDEGYYEVPPLSQQVREALERIARNQETSGAVTYSWDVTFYKPGVYGRRQPAEPLWHLVVDKAGAFDPVWQRAKAALEERMREIEPEGRPPSEDDFVLALRRARVREGSPS